MKRKGVVVCRAALLFGALGLSACSAGAGSDSSVVESAAPLGSAEPVQQAILQANDGTTADLFGTYQAIDGDTSVAVAQQPGDDGATLYVHTRTGTRWTETAKLRPSQTQPINGSMAIAISGNTIAFASQLGVFVFVKSGSYWNEEQRLPGTDTSVLNGLGSPLVAIDGDTIVIGMPQDVSGGENAGAASVYQRSNGQWRFVQELTAQDPAANDVFGLAVAVSGNHIAIGAPLDDDAGEDFGSAYVFERTASGSWSRKQKLLPDTPGVMFGYGIALKNQTLAIGAPHDSTVAEQAGAIYAFTESNGTWTQEAKLLPSEGFEFGFFGTAMGVSDTAIVGGGWGNHPRNGGVAYSYARATDGTWTQTAKLVPSDPEALRNWGFSVGLSGNTAVVGSPDRGTNTPGEVYVFTL